MQPRTGRTARVRRGEIRIVGCVPLTRRQGRRVLPRNWCAHRARCWCRCSIPYRRRRRARRRRRHEDLIINTGIGHHDVERSERRIRPPLQVDEALVVTNAFVCIEVGAARIGDRRDPHPGHLQGRPISSETAPLLSEGLRVRHDEHGRSRQCPRRQRSALPSADVRPPYGVARPSHRRAFPFDSVSFILCPV